MDQLALAPDETTTTLHDRLSAMGARLIVQALANLDQLPPQPQMEEGATYAHKIDKAEGTIDWTLPAAVIERRLRAFDPFPGGSAPLAGEAVKVWRARLGALQGPPGTVLALQADGPEVACGEGSLVLTELQRPGAKRAAAAAVAPGLGLRVGQLWD
jgi:methionyl-tRNA formyltransferase